MNPFKSDEICNFLLLSLLRCSIIQFLHFLDIFLCKYSCGYPNLVCILPAVVQKLLIKNFQLFLSVYKSDKF